MRDFVCVTPQSASNLRVEVVPVPLEGVRGPVIAPVPVDPSVRMESLTLPQSMNSLSLQISHHMSVAPVTEESPAAARAAAVRAETARAAARAAARAEAARKILQGFKK